MYNLGELKKANSSIKTCFFIFSYKLLLIGLLLFLYALPSIKDMLNHQVWCAQQHSWPCITHYFTNLFSFLLLIAMGLTGAAKRLALHIGAFFYSLYGIVF